MNPLRTLRFFVAMSCAASFLCHPVCALAQDPSLASPSLPKVEDLSEDEQRELSSLIDLAEANDKRGKFTKALGFFEEAYAILPHPKLLYRIARCQDQLGRQGKAIRAYEAFVLAMPDADEAEFATQRIAELRATVSSKTNLPAGTSSLRVISSPPGAVVYLGEEAAGAVGTTPTIELPVSPGEYVVLVRLNGYEGAEKTVRVGSDEAVTEHFELVPLDAEEQRAVRTRSRAVPFILLGVGVAAAGSGVYFLARSSLMQENPQDFDSGDSSRAQTLSF
ncbi:MAG: PEGA domain-containing protein, partial [Myxococcota bacterium]